MGMWLFIFEHEVWKEMYNCSMKTTQEWNAERRPNVPIGTLYLFMGIVCEIVYIPFLVVMLKQEFIKHSCYKLMFLLGAFDLLMLCFNAIMTGIQAIMGVHFCTNPILFYLLACIGSACWYGTSMVCIELAMNRCLELCLPRLASRLYNGYSLWLWLFFPGVYMFYTYLFEKPAFYNNKYFAWFFDPHAGITGLQDPVKYASYFHVAHNIFTMIMIGGCYAIICFYFCVENRGYNVASVSKFQKLLTLQSMVICFEVFLAATVYIYMQFFPVSDVFIVIGHVTWIMIHGDTPIVYLFLNATLRTAVLKEFPCTKFVKVTPSQLTKQPTSNNIYAIPSPDPSQNPI